MKKLVVLALFIVVASVSAFAQRSSAIGAGVAYSGKGERLGIELRGITNFNPTWGVGVTAIYWLPKSGEEDVTFWEGNVNVQYTFVGADEDTKLKLYGLGGVHFFSSSVSYQGVTVSATKIGFNVGAGLNYGLSDHVGLFAEARYTIASEGYGGFVPQAGVLVSF